MVKIMAFFYFKVARHVLGADTQCFLLTMCLHSSVVGEVWCVLQEE